MPTRDTYNGRGLLITKIVMAVQIGKEKNLATLKHKRVSI